MRHKKMWKIWMGILAPGPLSITCPACWRYQEFWVAGFQCSPSQRLELVHYSSSILDGVTYGGCYITGLLYNWEEFI